VITPCFGGVLPPLPRACGRGTRDVPRERCRCAPVDRSHGEAVMQPVDSRAADGQRLWPIRHFVGTLSRIIFQAACRSGGSIISSPFSRIDPVEACARGPPTRFGWPWEASANQGDGL